ncbi:MAG: hypothetical protein JNK54_03105 [Elusimicrobia bacterium]|nr:hypothetical protein [Elusimicrobiota bacterium]
MKSISVRILLSVGLIGSSVCGWARVNVLDPWAPGFDAVLSDKKWDVSPHLRIGSGGAGGTDLTEIGATVTMPLKNEWEMGAVWGFQTLDSSGVRDDSGVSDIAFAVKHRLPGNLFPDPLKAVGEFGVSLPTGDSDHGLGAGGIGLLGNAGLTLPLRAVRGYAQIGLKLYSEGRDTRWGNALSYSAGAMYPLSEEVMLSADFRVINHGRDKIDGVKLPNTAQEAYLTSGGVWKPVNGTMEAQGLLLLGLTGDAYDFGLQLGLKF